MTAIAHLVLALFLAQSDPSNLDFESGETGKVPPGWFVPPMLQKVGYSAELRRPGCKAGSGCAVVLVPAKPPSPRR